MGQAEFVHLHVHSQYSMLDGAIRIDPLAKWAKANKMRAIALTDHGNMFGAMQFNRACRQHGVLPILGAELSIAETKGGPAHHLLLLARSDDGYRSLIRLVSHAWVAGTQGGGPPVIDFGTLSECRKGLVGLSACLGGYLAQQILLRGKAEGRSALAKLRDCFEDDAFFVELQDHGFIEQKPLNQILVELAKELGTPLVASNDCHYPEQKDARAQLILQCIAGGRQVADMERSHHRSTELFLKTAEEMKQRFSHLPEAIENTLRVAEMCAGAVDPVRAPVMPTFPVPGGLDEPTYFRQLAEEGLARRFSEFNEVQKAVDEALYRQRLLEEWDLICSRGFASYFLVVQDFVNHAIRKGIPVGPGRGSGAGSLVAYALRITDLDPIAYGLLFERFLNPERVSMPDFDIDFCMDRRDEVIDYVREKYGDTSVGQIATFHALKSRSVVRDVARVMGLSPQEAGRIAGLIPEPVLGKSVPIAEALKKEPRLKRTYEEDARVHELIDNAQTLEDLTRHAGMHAAGVVISKGPLWEHVPVFCPEPGILVTQYDKDDVEAAGLVKFDFLGLRTLTVIDIASRLIERRPDHDGEAFRIDRIPLNDPATFALLRSGETTNVFQLESSGMQSLFKQLKPDSLEDVIAAVALYRPGPLGSGMVEDFVQRKHGRVPIRYPHPSLEPILKETYGVLVYQEQVMQVAREMAGYSLGAADVLRRAMGKKKPEEMAKQKAAFITGAIDKGFEPQDAERVFELMSFFAGYGFNKSHSAAYALLTYQTAFLKANYPVEYLARH
jgi:DNA polymerase-3 subunit alpha